MTKSKTVSCIAAMLLCSAIAFAQEDRPRISVLDFAASGISVAEVRVFVDYVSSHIVDIGKYRVIDRMQRDAILREIEFSQADCADEKCQLEIGRMLSAAHIVVGSIGKVGARYLLNIKLIEVETGETLKAGSEKYNSIEDLIDDSQRLVYAFLGESLQVQIVEEQDEKKTPTASAPPSPRVSPYEAFLEAGYMEADYQEAQELDLDLPNYINHRKNERNRKIANGFYITSGLFFAGTAVGFAVFTSSRERPIVIGAGIPAIAIPLIVGLVIPKNLPVITRQQQQAER